MLNSNSSIPYNIEISKKLFRKITSKIVKPSQHGPKFIIIFNGRSKVYIFMYCQRKYFFYSYTLVVYTLFTNIT